MPVDRQDPGAAQSSSSDDHRPELHERGRHADAEGSVRSVHGPQEVTLLPLQALHSAGQGARQSCTKCVRASGALQPWWQLM
jgi:hypothetical protein